MRASRDAVLALCRHHHHYAAKAISRHVQLSVSKFLVLTRFRVLELTIKLVHHLATASSARSGSGVATQANSIQYAICCNMVLQLLVIKHTLDEVHPSVLLKIAGERLPPSNRLTQKITQNMRGNS